MPRYLIYILVAIGVVIFFRLLAENFYDSIGYVERKFESDKKQSKESDSVDLNEIEALIDKKIAERDTITLELVSSSFIQGETKNTSIIQSDQEPAQKRPERQISQEISIKNPNLSDEEYFEQLREEYLNKVAKNIPPGKSRTDVVVRYYKHAPDGDNVYKLQELRYYIHERDANDATYNKPSNAIFYGNNIKSEDVQIVAYTLLENGVPIKTIRPSKFASDWKANSIEIGTDTTLFDSRNLSLAEVRGFIH